MSRSHQHHSTPSSLYTEESLRLSTIQRTSSMLRAASLAPSTLSAYVSAVSSFTAYCRSLPPHPHHDVPHPAAALDLDVCVLGYVSLLYSQHQGANRQLAVNTVYGLYLSRPEMRGLLRRSEQSLKGWARLTPPVSHPPLTWPLTVLIAATMAKNLLFDSAIATLVGFDALLRVSELVNIKVRDVSTLLDPRRGFLSSSSHAFGQQLSLPSSSRVCLRLPVTKTGMNQWTELYTDDVGILLSHWIQHKPPEAYVFQLPAPPSQRANYYRQCLRVTCDALGLSACHYTPHSLRHGGATHAHLQLNQSIEHVMHRGRWRSNDTCRAYIQAGKAALLTQELPAQVTALAAHLVTDWLGVLESLCFTASR